MDSCHIPGLADEVALLEPVFAAAGESFHLAGHSYDGAVALRAALADPGRVRSLVLIEPVLFGLLLAEDPGQGAWARMPAPSRQPVPGLVNAAIDAYVTQSTSTCSA